jgi:hypothetical protein
MTGNGVHAAQQVNLTHWSIVIAIIMPDLFIYKKQLLERYKVID